MEVDGDLKVTGTVESITIDSLKVVIADLQAQLAALQVDNKLETRVYEYEVNLLSEMDVDFTLSELTNGDLDDNQNAFIEVLDVSDDSQPNVNLNIILVYSYLGSDIPSPPIFVTIYSTGFDQPLYTTGNARLTYNGLFNHKFRTGIDFSGTLIIAVTAQFPN